MHNKKGCMQLELTKAKEVTYKKGCMQLELTKAKEVTFLQQCFFFLMKFFVTILLNINV